MISAAALIHDNARTIEMLARHKDEKVLAVQITSRTAEEMQKAVGILNKYNFESVDINMGCPVRKVVKVGCGSAILKDPERVYQTTALACKESKVPVTVKIRLGWDSHSKNYQEVIEAAQTAGAHWVTVHGRTRSDDYSKPVDLSALKDVKKISKIPVIGNGNLFSIHDVKHMLKLCSLDGVMISRGALGNPWIFKEIKDEKTYNPSLEEWWHTVKTHIDWQREAYGDTRMAIICMRKHLLWYLKGWPQAKALKEEIVHEENFDKLLFLLEKYVEELCTENILVRRPLNAQNKEEDKFHWDPKYEMDRKLDRGLSNTIDQY